MSKKKRTEEKNAKNNAAAVTECAEEKTAAPAQKPPVMSRQEARAMAVLQKQEKKQHIAALAAGVPLFLLTCLSIGNGAKIMTLLTLFAALGVLIWKRKLIRARFGVVALLLTAYCVMVTISGFYAPAGKFALQESIKFIAALAVFFMVLALEPEKKPGLCAATAVELSAAGVSLLSIDAAGARLLSAAVLPAFSALTGTYRNLAMLDRGHINSIFGNVNVFSGIAGLGVLLGLGLLSAERDAKGRRVHLVCLAINAAAFLDAFSRGATVVIAVCFLVYLLLERGESRGRALVLMVETAVFAGIAAIVGYLTAFGSGGEMRFAALAATLLCAAGLAAFDEFVGQRLADQLVPHSKVVTVAIVSLLGVAAVFAVAALNLTGPATVGGDAVLYRATYPGAGEHTLCVEADGNVNVNVYYVPKLEYFGGTSLSITEGEADGLSFTVPEDAGVVFFRFCSDDGATIKSARYDGVSSGEIKLGYRLLPESVALFLQGPFHSESFLLRRAQWATALRLWRESPIVGLGVGSFECRGLRAMPFYYETKYVHCHYLQMLLDTGVVGLALFLGLLAACAYTLVRAGKKETMNPMVPALGASLLFMAGQACTDVIFSSSYYLPSAFVVLAIIVVCTDSALHLPVGEKVKTWLPRTGLALLSVWVVLLGLNLYANMLLSTPSYDRLVTAAKLDYYERNDYRLSYVISVCDYEERTEEMTRQMYEYMEALEKAPSNTIPLYLGECYFKLGDPVKAFEMLQRYTDVRISDPATWEKAFLLTFQNYTDSEVCIQGVTALYRKMQTWNETALVPITLDEQMQHYIDSVVALS